MAAAQIINVLLLSRSYVRKYVLVNICLYETNMAASMANSHHFMINVSGIYPKCLVTWSHLKHATYIK